MAELSPAPVFETGREHRLTWLVEIIEAAHQLGDQVRVEVIAEVLDEIEKDLSHHGRHVPSTADLSPEEFRAVTGLLAIAGAVQDVVGYLAFANKPGRLRTMALKQADSFIALCREIMVKLPPELRTAAMLEASSWGYILLHPSDRAALLDIIEAAATTKGYVPADIRAEARRMSEKFGGLRKPAQEAQAERQAALR